MDSALTNRGKVNIAKSVAGIAAAATLTALLSACSSGGSTFSLSDIVGSSSPSTSAAASSTVPQVVPPKITADGGSGVAARPAGAHSQAGFPGHSAPTTSPHGSPSSPAVTGPITYQSVSFPRPYNCAEAGVTYYTAPNVTVAIDVTVLVTSPTLAKDLVITAPNRAPRGLSNASQWISSTSVGNGIWRATYRTFVGLYQPNYTPVTVSALQAAADGSHYTIAFPSPAVVTKSDCHS